MKVGRMERRHVEVTVVTVKQVWSTIVYAFTPRPILQNIVSTPAFFLVCYVIKNVVKCPKYP